MKILEEDVDLFKVNNNDTRTTSLSISDICIFNLLSPFRSGDNLDMENMSDISLKGQKSKEKRQMLTKKTQKWRSFSNRH